MENEHGIDLRNKHNDCGLLIFNLEEQDVNSGSSGCSCAGSVLCSHILKKMRTNKLKKVLFVATGTLCHQPQASREILFRVLHTLCCWRFDYRFEKQYLYTEDTAE